MASTDRLNQIVHALLSATKKSAESQAEEGKLTVELSLELNSLFLEDELANRHCRSTKAFAAHLRKEGVTIPRLSSLSMDAGMAMSRLSELWTACYVSAQTFLDMGSCKDLSDEDRALLRDFYVDEFADFHKIIGDSQTTWASLVETNEDKEVKAAERERKLLQRKKDREAEQCQRKAREERKERKARKAREAREEREESGEDDDDEPDAEEEDASDKAKPAAGKGAAPKPATKKGAKPKPAEGKPAKTKDLKRKRGVADDDDEEPVDLTEDEEEPVAKRSCIFEQIGTYISDSGAYMLDQVPADYRPGTVAFFKYGLLPGIAFNVVLRK